MRFTRQGKDTVRVDGLQNVFKIQERLTQKGKFSANKGLFTFHVPIMGDVVAAIDWWPNSAEVRIKKKPLLLGYDTIFTVLQEELEKANL